MSSSIVTTSKIPDAEIPTADDWFVWESAPARSTTAAARICFRSWLAPGSWLFELAVLCGATDRA